MSPGVATFLFETVNFALLAAALGWAFFRPVRDAIEARREALAEERRTAERASDDARRLRSEAEARAREVEASLEPLRAALRHDAESEAARVVASARARADEERAALRAELARMRRTQSETIAADAAAAARTLVEALLAEIGGPELDVALARAAARRVREQPELRSAGSDRTVIVESARPLSDEAWGVLAEALGPASDHRRLRIDPGLIAGVRVSTAGGLVDASAAGLARDAEHELAARLARDEERDG